ncbi:MAG: MFS transporter [Desulfobacteraceae bacterium]|nr:MAG: MFS transporter [Desulfobacteraceae bacterium]
MAAICFSIQALGIGIYIALGIFFKPLMEEFGWSRAAIAGASSTAFFSMGLFGVIAGRLNDRFGPRRLMSVAALLLGLVSRSWPFPISGRPFTSVFSPVWPCWWP